MFERTERLRKLLGEIIQGNVILMTDRSREKKKNTGLLEENNTAEGLTRVKIVTAFGERIEAWLAKFLVSLKSEHKDKCYRSIEIFAVVSSRIQEQLIIPTNIYQLLKSSTKDGGKRKTELLQRRLAIQRTNGELSVSRNGGYEELKKEIESLREDLERLRRQRIPFENKAVSTGKGTEDIESLKSSTEDGGKRKTELLQPRLAIQKTSGELNVSLSGGFGELKKEIERVRKDLERLRRQRIPSESKAVSTGKGSEDIESDKPANLNVV
ncbi:hypothetical protein AVEN_75256-1 [Araneus ventricosus]|uniref:Uncharacterized protein n=1 Tax=Araneus ventricosus TaxID=182803 RepID=A0A4Y2I981_ARAVE|nr:hypothetical protein AVEN_75256-1 [Araneus ventricosus]